MAANGSGHQPMAKAAKQDLMLSRRVTRYASEISYATRYRQWLGAIPAALR